MSEAEIYNELWVRGALQGVVLCQPCEAYEVETAAEWIVHYELGVPWFLCWPCLDRWRSLGFGTTHQTGARWERL